MPICHYCKRDTILCDAHIIPKAFFKDMQKSNTNYKLFLGSINNRTNRISPMGIYDNNILCANCDKLIGKFDEEGINFFRKNFELFQDHIETEKFYRISASEYNYLNLKKFFVSLLYRASISNRVEFKGITLGDKFTEEARYFLQHETDNKHFSIILEKRHFNFLKSLQNMILIPRRFKLGDSGINVYDITLINGIRAIIKVDTRDYPEALQVFELNNTETIILYREFEETDDFSFIQEYRRKLHKTKPPQRI